MAIVRSSGGGEKVTIDGKPVTEKMEFKKEKILIYKKDSDRSYKIICPTMINGYSFVYIYNTDYYNYESFTVSNFKDLSNIQHGNGYNGIGTSNRVTIQNLFPGNFIDTFYHIEFQHILVENNITNAKQTEIRINHSEREVLSGGTPLDENYLFLLYFDQYNNGKKSFYKYDKKNNSETLLLDKFTEKSCNVVHKHKDDIYCRIDKDFVKYNLSTKQITILFNPIEKFNKSNSFDWNVSADICSTKDLYFAFNSSTKELPTIIKYDLDKNAFNEIKIDPWLNSDVRNIGDVQIIISENLFFIYMYTNAGCFLREFTYRYSLSKN